MDRNSIVGNLEQKNYINPFEIFTMSTLQVLFPEEQIMRALL